MSPFIIAMLIIMNITVNGSGRPNALVGLVLLFVSLIIDWHWLIACFLYHLRGCKDQTSRMRVVLIASAGCVSWEGATAEPRRGWGREPRSPNDYHKVKYPRMAYSDMCPYEEYIPQGTQVGYLICIPQRVTCDFRRVKG